MFQALIYRENAPSRECSNRQRLSPVGFRPFPVVYRSHDEPSGSSLITRWPESFVFLLGESFRTLVKDFFSRKRTQINPTAKGRKVKTPSERATLHGKNQTTKTRRAVLNSFVETAHWACVEHERRLLYKSLKCDWIAEPSQKGAFGIEKRWVVYVCGCYWWSPG